MEYWKYILEEKRGKLHSRPLWKSSTEDALLYSFHNMNNARKEFQLVDIRFRIILNDDDDNYQSVKLNVHDEYYQALENQAKQGEEEV